MSVSSEAAVPECAEKASRFLAGLFSGEWQSFEGVPSYLRTVGLWYQWFDGVLSVATNQAKCAAHLAIFVTRVFRRVKNLSLAGFLHVLPTATDRAGPDALATLSVASMQWPRIDDNMIVVDPGALHRRDRWFP